MAGEPAASASDQTSRRRRQGRQTGRPLRPGVQECAHAGDRWGLTQITGQSHETARCSGRWMSPGEGPWTRPPACPGPEREAMSSLCDLGVGKMCYKDTKS